jgi:hypothetical protein
LTSFFLGIIIFKKSQQEGYKIVSNNEPYENYLTGSGINISTPHVQLGQQLKIATVGAGVVAPLATKVGHKTTLE